MNINNINPEPTLAQTLRPRAIADNIQLTDSQSEVLAFIAIFTRINKVAPTNREIRSRLDMSSNSVQESLKQLQSLGCIDWVPQRTQYQPRSLHLLIPIKIDVGLGHTTAEEFAAG